LTHAYTPAFDFDPKEFENMTDAEIMELLTRDCDNWQKGKVLREAFDAIKAASRPSALTLQPQKARKARTATPKPKSPASEAVNGFAGHVDNEGGVQ
jgi:hypothetical protein